MLNYDLLSKKPSNFRNFTGLEVPEFNTLNIKIQEKYAAYEEKRLTREDRKRTVGAGHPFKHSLTNRTLILLLYYHIYPSSTLLGYLVDLSQTSVLKNIRNLEPLVSEILPLPKKQYDKLKRLQTVEEIEAMFPGFKAAIDATDQQIPRPHAKLKRKTHYSGKRKKHTVKTQLTVNQVGRIIHKTAHAKGSTHDYSLFKHSRPHLPASVQAILDLGYKGIKKDYPSFNCAVPFKRQSPGRGKRGVKAQALTFEQKAFNSNLSRDRIVVEHIFSRLKKYHIWADEFRNRLKHYDMMTDNVCGLLNFRIMGTIIV